MTVRKVGEVARLTPEGYVHPQYFPTVWKWARKLPGMRIERMVREEVEEHRLKNRDHFVKTVEGFDKFEPDAQFYYAFSSYSNNFWAHVVDSDPKILAETYAGRESVLDKPRYTDLKGSRKRAREDPKHYHMIPKSVAERRTGRQYNEDIRRAFYGVGLKDEDLQGVLEKGRGTTTSIELGRLLFPVYVSSGNGAIPIWT